MESIRSGRKYSARNMRRRFHIASRKSSRFISLVKQRLKNRLPKSLARRIMLLQFVWAIAVYLLVISALWLATSLVIESNVRDHGEGWIAKLDELGIPIYASDDAAQLADAIAYVHNFSEVMHAKYYDASGKKIIAGYTHKNADVSDYSPLSEHTIAKLKNSTDHIKPIVFEKGEHFQMRISAPIWIQSFENDGMISFSLQGKGGEKIETIGFIEVVIDYSATSAKLYRNLSYASLLIAAMMIVAAYVGRKMVSWALSPLSYLEQPLTRLSKGETDVTVQMTGDEEVDRIGIALNTTISALNERDDSLRRLANHDALTGLLSRKYFVDQLEKEIVRINTVGGTSALFFFDLDRFKNINDNYGHAAGDRLLIQIAKQLGKRIRDRDLVARFGGDEFTLLAYNVNAKKAQDIAESLIQLMREFVFYESGDMIKVYFSIGITIIDDGMLNSHDYLKEADAAVHEAKRQGRNDFRLYKRTFVDNNEEKGDGWHDRLQDVILNDKMICYFQTVVGLKNQPQQLHEVLMRIPDLKYGILMPGAFMPAAERFGLMAALDLKMIARAAKILHEQANDKLVLMLNLSEQLMAEKNLLSFLEGVIRDNHVSPGQIIFELSESYVLHNIDRLCNLIPDLSLMGFRFAVDNFAAGLGSFNYLKQVPVHFIKLDSALIEQIAGDRIDQITVRAIVEIAASLNLQTIAKFATDQESIAMLKSLGIDYVQGNSTGEPLQQLSV
jgi:diguanylate cyclase (GGDEF)-like protein